MSHEVVRTRQGFWAVRDTTVGEVMHPGVGPLEEAERLYARQSGLATRLVERGAGGTVVLFDVGLGAASNALAARAVSERAPAHAARLEILSFERDLGALALALDHGESFGLTDEAGRAARALCASGFVETARTTWRLMKGELLDNLARETHGADIVFWDPFSPRANPGLWTVAAFSAMRRMAAPGCTLYTYSASTAVRVALLLAGWAVGVGDSIGAKTETTAAAIDVADLVRPLGLDWRRRLLRPDTPLPPDAPPGAALVAARAPQFGG